LISVCVPTYNGAPYIAAQLRSILRSPRVDELLVSDDGSTDGTQDVVRSIADARVQMLDGPRRGLIRNVETLLARARGDFVFLADQDDVWLPQKVDVMIDRLQHADLVVSDCQVTDADLAVVAPSFFALRGSGPGLWRNLLRNSYLGCCIAMRRDLLRHALPFPARVPMHDWWLGLVGEAFGKVAFIPDKLVLYRRHGANASTTAGPSQASWATRLRWRWTLAAALLERRLGLGRRPATG
jgi:glycosyltransferase involved in cell wall biosynthesis